MYGAEIWVGKNTKRQKGVWDKFINYRIKSVRRKKEANQLEKDHKGKKRRQIYREEQDSSRK